MLRTLLGSSAAVLCLAFAASSALAEDHPPKVDTSRPTPVVYPKESQARGEEGTVVLHVDVTSSGQPVRLQIVKSSGYADLDNAAMETAYNWHYVPAIRGGDTSEDWATVQIKYALPQTATAVAK